VLEKFYNKWFAILILIQPFFDVITSIMTKIGMSVTVGIFIKMFLLLCMAVYLVFVDKNNRKWNIIFISIVAIFCLGNVYYNLDILSMRFSAYAGYLMKYVYLVISIFFFLRWYRNGNRIEFHQFKITFAIISIVMLLSWVTGTYFSSYLEWAHKLGNSGWFFSANELGALLSIIFPITIYNALYNEKSQKYEFIFVLVIGLALLMLGTKVGLLGYFLTVVCYVIYRFIAIRKLKLDYRFALVLVLLIVPLIFWNSIPAVYNTHQKYEDLDLDNVEITETEKEEKMKTLIYSGRNGFIARMVGFRKDITIGERIFGKFYLRDAYKNEGEILITEQDPFDIYFIFGIFGTILLFAPLLYILFKCLKFFFKNFKTAFYDQRTILSWISIIITLGVSAMSGHTLLAPLASTFFVVTIMNLYIKDKNEDNRKQILIGNVHMDYGGIEKTLVHLLEEIDYKKYNVDLLLLKPEGVFLKDIPNDVNVITPYKSKLLRKIVLNNSAFCKLIKHALFNYCTGLLWASNKNYAAAISYSGYYSFIDMYVGLSNSKNKLIWVHTDMNILYKHDEKYRNKINRVKGKYKRFNKIVCVSEGVSEEFKKVLPKYSNKVTYMWNLMHIDTEKLGNDVKLSNKFNVVLVGRVCKQKRFDKLIDVVNNLKNKDDYRFYIIGDGELKSEFEKEIASTGYNKYITLFGARNDARAIMKESSLCLSTSDYEGLPTVLMEALVYNVPIVATDVCGNKDIYKYIAPKDSMLLVDNDPKAIANGLEEAKEGKISKKFTFDVNEYNKKIMKKFYELIGD